MAQARIVRPTALLMGEGDAEEIFLKRIRELYTADRKGCNVRVQSAGGKGAGNVVDHAIRYQRANGAFDVAAAFFDTDTDWNDDVRARGEKAGIVLIAVEPCLECMLLRLVGLHKECSTAEHKKRFEKEFGGPAHNKKIVERIVTREAVDKARGNIVVIDTLLTTIGR
ncbi:hypothetical protein [Ramlibacter sp. PS4R-6]|uniref:hypothetical protein n=1 Tax=Ramlibacter sp. PS4R-6 TaxID=3133438 RepID=UPI0030B451A3